MARKFLWRTKEITPETSRPDSSITHDHIKESFPPILDGVSNTNNATSLVDPKPELTLYANDLEESVLAFAAIEKARISFRVIPARDQSHPSAVWGGDTFTGLNEIEALTEFLREIDARLDADIARKAIPLFAKSDPQVKQAAEEEYQRYLAAAQAVMASLQKAKR